MPANYKIVANIPYYLTGHLLQLVSETPNRPKTVAFLLQKEVAQRVAAQSGGMSILAITTQYYWHVELGRIIPARLFTPPPKIDSQILLMKRRSILPYPDIDINRFFRLIKIGYSQRRKILLNNLTHGLPLSRDKVQKIFDECGIESTRRAQTLNLDEWHKLYRSVHT